MCCIVIYLCAVYQIIDDYLADAVDAMETEFKRACEKRKVDLKGKKGEVVEKVGQHPSAMYMCLSCARGLNAAFLPLLIIAVPRRLPRPGTSSVGSECRHVRAIRAQEHLQPAEGCAIDPDHTGRSTQRMSRLSTPRRSISCIHGCWNVPHGYMRRWSVLCGFHRCPSGLCLSAPPSHATPVFTPWSDLPSHPPFHAI